MAHHLPVVLHLLVAAMEEDHLLVMEVTGSVIGVLDAMMEEEIEAVMTEAAEMIVAVMIEEAEKTVDMVVALEGVAVASMAAEVVLIKAATMEDPVEAAAVGIGDLDETTSLFKKIPFSYLECRHL